MGNLLLKQNNDLLFRLFLIPHLYCLYVSRTESKSNFSAFPMTFIVIRSTTFKLIIQPRNKSVKYFNNFVRICHSEQKIHFARRHFLLDDELFELIVTTTHLQEESKRLEHEARKLVDAQIQVQIEARLSKDKCHHRRQKRRYSVPIKNKRLNFRQLKQELQRQRQSFLRFERRLRAKYEQPFYDIVSNSTKSQQRRCRRIRSIPSESID